MSQANEFNDNKNINDIMSEHIKLVYLAYNKLDKNYYVIKEKDELYAVGLIGLWKGVKTYDKTKKIKPSTYLYRCIKNEMLMFLRGQSGQNAIIQNNSTSTEVIVGTGREGDIITLGDMLSYEHNYVSLNIDEYVDIYFRHSKDIPNARKLVPQILKLTTEGYTQLEIGQMLNVSRNTICKYISNIRKAIIAENVEGN